MTNRARVTCLLSWLYFRPFPVGRKPRSLCWSLERQCAAVSVGDKHFRNRSARATCCNSFSTISNWLSGALGPSSNVSTRVSWPMASIRPPGRAHPQPGLLDLGREGSPDACVQTRTRAAAQASPLWRASNRCWPAVSWLQVAAVARAPDNSAPAWPCC